MKRFAISRASALTNDKSPTKGAFAETHKASTGRPFTKWYIELNSLDELMSLVDCVGTILLAEDTITIYDDYVE